MWPTVRFEPTDAAGKPVRWIRIAEKLIKAHGLAGRASLVVGNDLRGERAVVFADKEAATIFLLFAGALAEVKECDHNVIWRTYLGPWPWE